MPNFTFPAKYAPLLPQKSGDKFPYWKWFFPRGGRGGAKTRSDISLVTALMREEFIRCLCVREIQRSIRESSLRGFKDEIERQGLGYKGTNEFEVTDQEIRHVNGGLITFAGLRHNIDNIKSLEGYNTVLGVEARNFSQLSLDKLLPTVLRNPNPRFIFEYNPEEEDDPIHKLADSLKDDPSALILEISLDDNPWASEDMFEQRAKDYATDPDKAAWVWGGKCLQRSDAQVFGGRYSIEDFEIGKDWNGPYLGLDFGFARDPNHGVAVWVDGDNLYISHEAYGEGIEIDDIPGLLMCLPEYAERVLRCDNARPETISYLQRHGYPKAKGAKKWPGSIEDGISWVRKFNIIIHTRCTNMAEQARMYRYKVDDLSGDVTNKIIDAHNHGWDAVRYACEPMIFAEKEVSSYKIPQNFGMGTVSL